MKEKRVCKRCEKEKFIEDFPSHKKHRFRCKVCQAEMMREWYRRNPKKKKANAKKHYVKSRFHYALKQSKYTAKHASYAPCNATEEQIKEAFTGKCHACAVPEIECKRRLNMDHCHETGVFRGWLCDNCNRALGHLKDSGEIIASLLLYIERSKVNI